MTSPHLEKIILQNWNVIDATNVCERDDIFTLHALQLHTYLGRQVSCFEVTITWNA